MVRRLASIALVYVLSVAGMTYSVLQLDSSLLRPVSAEWANGCCDTSADCAGKLLCYSHPEARACGKTVVTGEDGYAIEKTQYGYCNDRKLESGGGDGGGIEIEQ